MPVLFLITTFSFKENTIKSHHWQVLLKRPGDQQRGPCGASLVIPGPGPAPRGSPRRPRKQRSAVRSRMCPPHSLLPARLSAFLLMAPCFRWPPGAVWRCRVGSEGREGCELPRGHVRVGEAEFSGHEPTTHTQEEVFKQTHCRQAVPSSHKCG